MSKKTHLKPDKESPVLNLVAKNAFKFNKAHVIADKRKYNRKAKQGSTESFIIQLTGFIIKGFALTV